MDYVDARPIRRSAVIVTTYLGSGDARDRRFDFAARDDRQDAQRTRTGRTRS